MLSNILHFDLPLKHVYGDSFRHLEILIWKQEKDLGQRCTMGYLYHMKGEQQSHESGLGKWVE